MISSHSCNSCTKFEDCKYRDDYLEYVEQKIVEHAKSDIPKNVIVPVECALFEKDYKKIFSNR